MFKWYKIYRCKKCKQEMCLETVVRSGGVCPYCGNQSDSTIIDTEGNSARIVFTGFKWYVIPMFKREIKTWE